MRIYPDNCRQFEGQTIFTLWDHDECGGYGYFSEKQEAIDFAARVFELRSYYGSIPFMLLIEQTAPRRISQPILKIVNGSMIQPEATQ